MLDGPITLAEAPTVTADRNGELRLVVTDGGSVRWNRRRPGESWAGWNELPRQAVWSRPVLVALGDGRVSVYAVTGPGGELLRATELVSWTTPH